MSVRTVMVHGDMSHNILGHGLHNSRGWVWELGGLGNVNTILENGGSWERPPGQPVAEVMTRTASTGGLNSWNRWAEITE